MKRNIHNRNTNNTYKEQKKENVCILPDSTKQHFDEEEDNEVELLLKEYKILINQINITRGKLYRLGFDPEKLT